MVAFFSSLRPRSPLGWLAAILAAVIAIGLLGMNIAPR
jgi:hypothetical protein